MVYYLFFLSDPYPATPFLSVSVRPVIICQGNRHGSQDPIQARILELDQKSGFWGFLLSLTRLFASLPFSSALHFPPFILTTAGRSVPITHRKSRDVVSLRLLPQTARLPPPGGRIPGRAVQPRGRNY